ncbi:DUF6461 domain-containing protein [Kitasatospora sp. NPDC090308]|uniref:DUF6461 domain-containing protein n=1 Tax=Kitasatospora sp. NPDC090308 TaxID=3364082 RepID=UPI00380BEAE8
MTSTAHDYAWITDSDWFPDCLDAGYSLTLVRGRPPREALDLLGAVPQGFADGVDDLFDCAEELRAWVRGGRDASFTVGALPVPGDGGDWTLLLALDRSAGLDAAQLAALSRGGDAVQHDSAADGSVDRFRHYRDGERRVSFAHPDAADGPDAAATRALLAEVDRRGGGDLRPAVFALAERLTGVRITEELVRDGAFALGVVPDAD